MKMQLLCMTTILYGLSYGAGYTINITNKTNIQLKFLVKTIATGPFCKEDPLHPLSGVIEPGATAKNIRTPEKGGMPCCVQTIKLIPVKRKSQQSNNDDLPAILEYSPKNKCGSTTLTMYEAIQEPKTILIAVESK